MNNKSDANPGADTPANGNAKAQHEPLRHSQMYVSLLFSFFVSLLG